jgi:hypothetical protein
MRFLIDENMSSPVVASRLRAQGHDPVPARDVGLLSPKFGHNNTFASWRRSRPQLTAYGLLPTAY